MTRQDPEPEAVRPFRLSDAPSIEARVHPSVTPIVFSRMRNDRPLAGACLSPRPEDAFSFQLPLINAAFSELRYANRSIALPKLKEPGRAFLLDLSARVTVGLDTAFDNVRFFIAQDTIDALAVEKGLRPVGGLVQREFGDRDPILFHLACALVPALEDPKAVTQAFVEHLGLAFHQHVIKAYGGVLIPERRRGGRLAPWQIRRVRDLVEADLAGSPSISTLAQACGLSTSYFNDAFKMTMGVPPHRWILGRRIAHAKRLLAETDLALADIAVTCGFYDQGHFSRAFSRAEDCSPNAWRRRRFSD